MTSSYEIHTALTRTRKLLAVLALLFMLGACLSLFCTRVWIEIAYRYSEGMVAKLEAGGVIDGSKLEEFRAANYGSEPLLLPGRIVYGGRAWALRMGWFWSGAFLGSALLLALLSWRLSPAIRASQQNLALEPVASGVIPPAQTL